MMTNTTSREAAEAVAVEALSFLARDADRISGFLASAGIGPERLREVAREPGFLAAVLDYLLADEPLLLMFSEDSGIPARTVPAARMVLGNPEKPF
jgi:hypothetical protein